MPEPNKPQNTSDIAGQPTSERIRCSGCGANNFPGSTICWQCQENIHPTLPRKMSALSAQIPPSTIPVLDHSVDPALGLKAAAALGMMFPPVAIPVGMVLLMMSDPRLIRLGWVTIGWGVVGTIINVIVCLATIGPLISVLRNLMPGSGNGGIPGIPPSLSSPEGPGFLLLLQGLNAACLAPHFSIFSLTMQCNRV